MSITRCRHLAILILCSCLPAITVAHGETVSYPLYPQIVRISHVEGDVRISRGMRNERGAGATWEMAATNLPLETGFNLVTGAGRAEIELEDASTVYLGENSALAFNDLHTEGGVPYTDMALITGTATLNVRLASAGELFVLRTPSHTFMLKYPADDYVRVNSYLDGMAVTPQKSMVVGLNGAAVVGLDLGATKEELAKGQTTIYQASGHSVAKDSGEAFAEWDNWVANRVASRSAAMTAVMKASGLASPIPGLAEMNGQGTFFSCAPYGTCWEPANLQGEQPGSESHDVQQVSAPVSVPVSSQVSLQSAQAAQTIGSRPVGTIDRDFFFPCPPTRIHSVISRDPATGRERVLYSTMDVGTEPYDWAVCHAGSWIYRQHRYAWVAGNQKHHHCPVHWIKAGRSVAYVPIHPRDLAGKPPINRVHGVFAIGGKGRSAERIDLDSGAEVRVLKTPPKEFRTAYSMPLSRADDPRVEVHRIGTTLAAIKGSGMKEDAARLTFNLKSQSFMLAKQEMQGVKGSPEFRAFNGHIGNIQGRSESFGGRSEFSGGSGGASRSSGGGFSSGSGGSHSGGVSSSGGFSGGGGSSHGGGGGRP
jgi:hypothetical protein